MKLKKVIAMSFAVMLTAGAFFAGTPAVVKAQENAESIQMIEESVAVDETHFPDEEFRNYLSKEKDLDKDGVLSKDEISKIEEINVEGNEAIKSLQGIEFFPKLRRLYCGKTENYRIRCKSESGIGSLVLFRSRYFKFRYYSQSKAERCRM